MNFDYKKNGHKLESFTGTASTEKKTDKYDKFGRALGLEEWAKLLDDKEYSRIFRHETKRYVFSTVWIGLDHSWGEGRPLIFESMAFKRKENGEIDSQGLYQDRYSTLNKAKIGHFIMILKVLWRELITYLSAVGNPSTKDTDN